MMIESIKYLNKDKYNNHKVYIHNFSGFDGIFILRNMINLGITNPIINDNRIITIDLTFLNEKKC